MTEWIKNPHSQHWLLWEEQLTPNRWLVCFRPAKGHNNDHWVNVMQARWSTNTGGCPPVIEEHILNDVLVQACIMHEMRKKYGASDGAL